MKIGIDFGTTNSAVAAIGDDGSPRTLCLFPGERVQRSVLHQAPDGEVRFGNAAFAHYVEDDMQGRLLRSLKAFLSQDVPKTQLAGKPTAFHELVSYYLGFLLRRVRAVTGREVTEVVLGRPVRFHAEPERDALALERLTAAVEQAGVPGARFVLEPVAAAHRYEHGLTRERIVLVGDFGGGTADFAVLRVGPGRVGRDRMRDVLATGGVALAGDALDGRFVQTFLLDHLGRGTSVRRVQTEEVIPWEHPILRHVQRLYYLHMLREKGLEERLESVWRRSSDRIAIRRLIRLIFEDLGFPMAWAIETAKRELSQADPAVFRFDGFYDDRLDLELEVGLAALEGGAADMLEAYGDEVGATVERAGLRASDVHEVFLTGGTSNVPFVRQLFARHFGSAKLRSADAFTSVCEGLALA